MVHGLYKAPTRLWNNLGKERYVSGKFGYLIAWLKENSTIV